MPHQLKLPFSLLKIIDRRYCDITATVYWSFGGDLGKGHSSFLKFCSHEQELVMFRDSEFCAVRLAPAVLVKALSGHHFT